MQKAYILLSLLVMLSCNKMDDEPTDMGENNITLIDPVLTNSGYSETEKEHFVVRNDKTHTNKLLLFIGGSYSSPKSYSRICEHAATLGLDVMSLSYPNNVATAPLGSSSDSLIFDKYRNEICFGNQISDEVDVDILNSINTRTVNLLNHLITEYPAEGWNQYLSSDNTLNWEKIIVSGHSQGAGHACYLGKQNTVDRVVMFSGPNDYSTFYDEPGKWLSKSGSTSIGNHFSLLHEQDEVVPFIHQVSNLRGMGILAPEDNPLLVDDKEPPYESANSLSIDISAISNHSSTIGAHPSLPDIWTYLFTRE